MRTNTVHVFQPDLEMTDHRGDHPCTCGMPKQWRGHDIPDTPEEAREIDARILGETE
jgi:hypothetical protein